MDDGGGSGADHGDSARKSRVEDVFRRRTVFLTGATGFLGKVVVEKILRSLPDVSRIYVVIRKSKGQSAQERLDKLLQGILFDRVRRVDPHSLRKVVAVDGDLMVDRLGLSAEDWQRLAEDVNIVIHLAATVKFDEPPRVALEMNVEGTRRVIALCKAMRNLECFIHTSTAYANCQLQRTEERVYPLPFSPEDVRGAVRWMNDDMLNSVMPVLLDGRPNTYTLTKAIAEQVVQTEADSLPVVIVRPSIVTATAREPMPGWTDNLNGPTGIFVAVAKGLLTNAIGDPEVHPDLVPVDIVANMLLAAVWHHSVNPTHDKEGKRTAPIPVVHCTSRDLNPLIWRPVINMCHRFYQIYPSTVPYGVPSGRFHKTKAWFEVAFHVKHVWPGYAIDRVLQLVGKKPILTRVYQKLRKMTGTLQYFMTHEWHFESKAMVEMHDALCPDDQKVFNFDVRQVDWLSYMWDCMMGAKLYILNERIEDLPTARINYRLAQTASYVVHALWWFLFAWIFGFGISSHQLWWILAGAFVTFWVQHNNIRPPVRMKSLDVYLAEAEARRREESPSSFAVDAGADHHHHGQ